MIDPFSQPTLEERIEMNRLHRENLKREMEELLDPRLSYTEQSAEYIKKFEQYTAAQASHLQMTEYARSIGK